MKNLLLIIVILMLGSNLLSAKVQNPSVDCRVTSISENVIVELKKRIRPF